MGGEVKKVLVGIIMGIFLCCSFYEIIHKTIEITDYKVCSVIYDKLNDKWHPDFTRCLKVVYKVFAFPVKTIYVYNSKDEDAIYTNFKWTFRKKKSKSLDNGRLR